jgi:hypothetical protein
VARPRRVPGLQKIAGQSLSRLPLDVDSITSCLDEYLEVEFTFIHTEELSAVLAGMPRERQDFILEWARRAAATNTELAFQFANRARQALLELPGPFRRMRGLSRELGDAVPDGKPDDYDLEYRGEYGIEDTRQALFEVRRDGIHAYCISIDREGRDYLPHMYGAANYTVLDDVAKLPTKVSDIYRKITS